MKNRLTTLSMGFSLSLGLVLGLSACSAPEPQAPVASSQSKASESQAEASAAPAVDKKVAKANVAKTVAKVSEIVDSAEYQAYIAKYEDFVGTEESENESAKALTFEKDTLAVWKTLEPYVLFDANSQVTMEYMNLSFDNVPPPETKDVIYKSAVLYDLHFLFDDLDGTREFVDNVAEVDKAGKYSLVDGGFLIKNKEGHILRALNLPLGFEQSGKVLSINDLLAASLEGTTAKEVKSVVHNDVIVAMQLVEGELDSFKETKRDLKDFNVEELKSKIVKNDLSKIDVKFNAQNGNYTVIGSSANTELAKGTIEYDRDIGKIVDKMDIGKIGALSRLSLISNEIYAARFKDYADVMEYLPTLQTLSISDELRKAKADAKENTIDVTVDNKVYKIAIGDFEEHAH